MTLEIISRPISMKVRDRAWDVDLQSDMYLQPDMLPTALRSLVILYSGLFGDNCIQNHSEISHNKPLKIIAYSTDIHSVAISEFPKRQTLFHLQKFKYI